MKGILLLPTLAALLSGPLLFRLGRARPGALSLMDGFIFVTVGGLVLFDVLPETLETGGLASAAFMFAGAWLPTAFERALQRARRLTHELTLAIAIAGLLLHHLSDGAALALAEESLDWQARALGLAVVVHSLPLGLLVWWLLFPIFGRALPSLALLGMCACVLLGYAYGGSLQQFVSARGTAWFQALVGGSLIHVVFGRPHLDPAQTPQRTAPRMEGMGNLLGVMALLLLLGAAHPLLGEPHSADLQGAGLGLLALSLHAAPALVLAQALCWWPSARAWLGRFGGHADHAATRFAQQGGLLGLLLTLTLLGPAYAACKATVMALNLIPALLASWRRGSQGDDRGDERHDASADPPALAAQRLTAWAVLGLLAAAALSPLLSALPWASIPPSLKFVFGALAGRLALRGPSAGVPLAATLWACGAGQEAAMGVLLAAPALAVLGRDWRSWTGALPSLVLAGALSRTPLPMSALALPATLAWICLLPSAVFLVQGLLRHGGRSLLGSGQAAEAHTH